MMMAVIGITVLSCTRRDPLSTTEPTETFTNVEDYLRSSDYQPTHFNFDISVGGEFVAPQGTKITVPSNALVSPSGGTVSGNVTLTVKEVYTPANMLATGVYPVSNGEPLASGGQFFLEFSQGSTVLKAKPGQSVFVEVPAQNTSLPMELFVGPSQVNATGFQWNPIDSLSSSNISFNVGGNTYEIDLTEFGWVNCDAFPNTPKADFDVELVGVTGLDYTNTYVVAHYPSLNSLLQYSTSSNFTNNLVEVTNGPLILQDIFALSIINNKVYFGSTSVTPTSGQVIQITMNEVTSADIQNYLNSL